MSLLNLRGSVIKAMICFFFFFYKLAMPNYYFFRLFFFLMSAAYHGIEERLLKAYSVS